ncbi:hypothetical protein BDZ89DRAFT_1077217 [Hymenopellis radicata]|nr:hypothetical protein BDZ89DRAFT_1077217 [Hymenopellis radicata]
MTTNIVKLLFATRPGKAGRYHGVLSVDSGIRFWLAATTIWFPLEDAMETIMANRRRLSDCDCSARTSFEG